MRITVAFQSFRRENYEGNLVNYDKWKRWDGEGVKIYNLGNI